MRLFIAVIVIIVVVAAGRTVTIPLAVAGDGFAAHWHDDLGMVHLSDEPVEARAGDNDSAGSGHLIGMFRDYRAWLDQLIDSKGRLVRSHREKAIHVNDSEVWSVESTLGGPISDQPRVASPEDSEAIGEPDDVAGLRALVTSEARGDTRRINYAARPVGCASGTVVILSAPETVTGQLTGAGPGTSLSF